MIRIKDVRKPAPEVAIIDEMRSIDMVPIYLILITENLKKGQMIRFDSATKRGTLFEGTTNRA